jgi:hypothetical protein
MLKGVEYLAVISAIVFAVCIVALMFFYASPSSTPQAPYQQHSEKNEPVQNKRETEKPFWQKATTDPVAAFTLFLVIFTAVLSGVSVIQLRLLMRGETIATNTAQAAKDSADAAQKSANAAIAMVPRAWLYVEIDPLSRPKVSYITGFVGEGLRSFNVEIPIKIRNVGKAPALIKEIKSSLFVPKSMSFPTNPPNSLEGDIPELSKAEDGTWLANMAGQLIINESDASPVFTPSFFFPRQPDFKAHIEGLPKWIYIVIRYSDPAGSDRETSYYAQVGLGGGLTIIPNDKYTYWH